MVILKVIHMLARLALRSALKYEKKSEKVSVKNAKRNLSAHKLAERLENKAIAVKNAAWAAEGVALRKRYALKSEAERARNLADKLKELKELV